MANCASGCEWQGHQHQSLPDSPLAEPASAGFPDKESHLTRPRGHIQTRAPGVFSCYGKDFRMVQGSQVPPVMNKSITYLQCCRSNITGDMHPEGIPSIDFWCPDMDVDIGAVRMVDDAAVE